MPVPSPHLLALANDLAEIPRAATELETWAEPLELPMPDLMALQLALEETITNVINHGYRDQPPGTRRFTVEFSATQSGTGGTPVSNEASRPVASAHSASGLSLPAPGSPLPSVRLVITDDAPAYDPLARPEVDTSLPLEDRPIGGLGVHLVKKLMTHAAYARHEGHNILTLERVLGHASLH